MFTKWLAIQKNSDIDIKLFCFQLAIKDIESILGTTVENAEDNEGQTDS
jgi:hypothetical protein